MVEALPLLVMDRLRHGHVVVGDELVLGRPVIEPLVCTLLEVARRLPALAATCSVKRAGRDGEGEGALHR